MNIEAKTISTSYHDAKDLRFISEKFRDTMYNVPIWFVLCPNVNRECFRPRGLGCLSKG